MRRSTGAEALCDLLLDEGVEVIFGHPGGAILPFYDALHRNPRLRHVLVRHEQAAAHAADGYARTTGKVGVCLATSGPGATNLVTGLATAIMDSVPLVAITGQVATTALGTEAFQEADIVGVTMPVTKHSYLVKTAEELEETVREAFEVAQSGKPGPVLIDLPKDVQVADLKTPRRPAIQQTRPAVAPTAGITDTQLDEAARYLNAALRPVMMVGRGTVLAGVTDQVFQLAERAEIPVITTLLGLDGFPASHPLALGIPGMHGTERANRAIQAADVILGLGLRFDDRVTGRVDCFAPHARIIHLDIDPATVGRTPRPTLHLTGHLQDTLPRLAERVHLRTPRDWHLTLRQWSRCAEPESHCEEDGPLKARSAIRAVAKRVVRSGGVVVTDVGQHQMWLAQELPADTPRTHLTSGGLGTMGYALPAGIGAAIAQPNTPTWVVAGDGGFQMNLQELATVSQEGVPLRIVVVNNGFLGMVRQWQELFYERRYSASELSGPDLVTLSHAYGIPARSITCQEELPSALQWADAAEGPVLLDLRVVDEENVYPLVPAGASLSELVTAAEREAS